MTWRDVEKEKILKVLEYCDGWTILKPEFLINVLKIPKELVDKSTQVYRSGSDIKSTIFSPEGQILEEVKGVYTLHLLEQIGEDLGVKPKQQFIGRGFRAEAWKKVIKEKLQEL